MTDTLDTRSFVKKLIQEGMEIGLGAIGGWFSRYFITEMVGDKKKHTPNWPALKADAPHFAMSQKDEAEFNVLVTKLQPTLQKNLEANMGPAKIGNHQRAALIITICEMLVRQKLGMKEEDLRPDAIETLRQLAEVADPVEWKRRAVAFRLMKENERDYLGAKLTEQASAALVAAIAEFRQTERDLDRYLRRIRRGQRRQVVHTWHIRGHNVTWLRRVVMLILAPVRIPFNALNLFGRS